MTELDFLAVIASTLVSPEVDKISTQTSPGIPSLLRRLNDRAALSVLIDSPESSRNEIATATGLSKVTVAESLRRLEHLGLVRELGKRSGLPGRQALLYEPILEHALAVAANIRHDGISATLVNAAGTIYPRVIVPAEKNMQGPALLEEATRLALEAAGYGQANPIELLAGIQASVDLENDCLSCAENLDAWPHAAVAATLSSATGIRVQLENDANLAADAESTRGSAKGTHSFVLAWLDCGPGLAIVVGDRLLRGASGSAGEIGYLIAPSGSDVLGAPVRHLSDLIDAKAVTDIAAHYGLPHNSWADTLTSINLLRPNHPFYTSFALCLRTALTPVLAVVDPAVIVLHGPIGLAGGKNLASALSVVLSHEGAKVLVLPPQIEDDAVLVGATIRLQAAMRATLLARIDEPV